MLLDFNNKYFTLAAIIFGIYVVYNVQSSKPKYADEIPHLDVSQTAKYVMEIDPKKPDTERSFFERTLYKYALSKKVELEAKMPRVVEYPLDFSDLKIEKGDQVTLRLRNIAKQPNEVEPLTIIVGNEMMPKVIEEALISMKQGEIKVVDHAESKDNIIKYEIKVVSVLPKSRSR